MRRIHARALQDDALLSDRAASYFGGAGQTFLVRAKLRASGTLTLTEDRLTYEPDASQGRVEIPIETMCRIGMGSWHEGSGSYVPVLKITHRKNLVFGVQVAHPERWIEAIEGVAARHHIEIAPMPDFTPSLVFRRPRILVALFLLLVLIVSAVPQFFMWVGPVRPAVPSTLPAGASR
jgi:hypothetical protein